MDRRGGKKYGGANARVAAGPTYVDRGATYRATALKVLEAAIDPLDEPAVTRMIDVTEVRMTTGDGNPEPPVLVAAMTSLRACARLR